MIEKQSISEYYRQRIPEEVKPAYVELGPFNVFRKDDVGRDKAPVKYARREFFKIALIHGNCLFHYADKTIEINGSTLVFSNPDTPYTFEPIKEEAGGYFCIFRESFYSEYLRNSLKELPMYRLAGSPAYALDNISTEQVNIIFEKMIKEVAGEYQFKYDLIRNYVTEIIHTALKLEPSGQLYAHTDASKRITAVFMELLERQFPIEKPGDQFKMKSPADFARQLSVHVNHLNRAVKQTTGKTTSTVIYERLTSEAKALLKHTDWNVAEIGFSLGFDDPTHFNHFFRKQTNSTPMSFRN
ncbi:AraC family transcriptional regulator [Mucilaginibacter sp. 22184]|uniref:AraC family transcriptional regulator n=1 Tax=Mucilaginibacter sp. 22184 TaxID=3453887 RepID=UPI003F87248B